MHTTSSLVVLIFDKDWLGKGAVNRRVSRRGIGCAGGLEHFPGDMFSLGLRQGRDSDRAGENPEAPA